MRCAQCERLVLTQAVGIHPDGRVIFGWCLHCLVQAKCRLVEIEESGPKDLKLNFRVKDLAGHPEEPATSLAHAVDPSPWILPIVAFLLTGWGLLLLAAGVFHASEIASGPGPAGPGMGPSLFYTPAILGLGGAVSAFLGVGLLALAARRDALPVVHMLVLVRWISFASGLAILGFAALRFQPGRNVSTILGAGVAMLVSVACLILERAERVKPRRLAAAATWHPSALAAESEAGEANWRN